MRDRRRDRGAGGAEDRQKVKRKVRQEHEAAALLPPLSQTTGDKVTLVLRQAGS